MLFWGQTETKLTLTVMIKITIALLNDQSGVKKRRSLRISDNFIITKVSISYGTDFQKVQNRILYGWYYSGFKSLLRKYLCNL